MEITNIKEKVIILNTANALASTKHICSRSGCKVSRYEWNKSDWGKCRRCLGHLCNHRSVCMPCIIYSGHGDTERHERLFARLAYPKISSIDCCVVIYWLISPWPKWPPFCQTTFSYAFSWMKSFVFWFQFQWSLFLWVQLTISQYWFR